MAKNRRLFHGERDTWDNASGSYTLDALELKARLELGIDARDVRRPGKWHSRANVQFIIHDGLTTASGTIALRVAPALTHHHLQLAQ